MASTYVSSRHDLGITNIGADGTGTDIIGMMLAKKGRTPVWNVLDGKLLADQFFSDVPQQDYTDPEVELLLGQSDWRSGFGLEIYDRLSPKRYYSSIGADLRFRGMAIAGAVPTTVTKPTITPVDVTDGGFEIWTDATNLTNWTESGGMTWTKTAGARTGGSGSWFARTTDATGDAVRRLWQTLTWAAGDEYRSRCFTFSCWIRTAEINLGRIAIFDGVARSYSSYHTGGGAWEQLTVTRQLNAAATELTLEIHDDNNSGVNLDVDDATLTDPTDGATVAFVEFNDNLYITMGNILAKLNAGGTGFDYVYSFPATITDLEPFTDDRLYIALGTSNAYWYMNTSEAFTQSTAAVKTFQFFKTVHSATPVLWGNDGVNTIRSNTNPINGGAAWSAQTTVGSSYYNITSLITKSGALYIPKEDMIYYLNSAGAVQNDFAPELQSLLSSTSGKNAKVYKNYIYTHAGTQGLFRSDGTTNEFINPASSSTNLSDFAGQIFALAYDEEWLFVVIDNSTKIEILAGHDETIDGSTSFIWHPINEITLTGCETAYVSTIYQKRLWISSTSGSDSLYYIPLPTGYGNITADANRSFKTGTYFITPYLHGNFPNTMKGFIKLTCTLGHAYDADIYVTAAYEKLGDASWTNIGNFDGTAANRVESLFIPVDGSANNPKSTMMRFKFTFVTDDTQKTPILLNYTASAILYPTIRTIYYTQVSVREDMVCKDGTVEKNMYDTIQTTLDNTRNSSWPVSIRDIDGTTRTVKFLPLPQNTPRYEVVRDEKGREQERVYSLMMMSVPLS